MTVVLVQNLSVRKLSVLRLRGIAFEVVISNELRFILILSISSEVEEVVIASRIVFTIQWVWICNALGGVHQRINTTILANVDQIVWRWIILCIQSLVRNNVFADLAKIDKHARARLVTIDTHHDLDVIDVVVVEVRIERRQQTHHSTPDLRLLLVEVCLCLCAHIKRISIVPSRILWIQKLRIRIVDTTLRRVEDKANWIDVVPTLNACTIRIHIYLCDIRNELLIPERLPLELHGSCIGVP